MQGNINGSLGFCPVVLQEYMLFVLQKSRHCFRPLLGTKLGNIQWSTSDRLMQDALWIFFEGSVIPALEHSCKAMFEQLDSAFWKGMSKYTTITQQQFFTSHSTLASTLQDTVASASSLAQSLKEGTSSSRVGTLITAKSNDSLGLPDKAISLEHLEESLDPANELLRLVSECNFEEEFNKALKMNDVPLVSWLCSQVDLHSLFTMVPLPLSQGVLLALVQQLGYNLENDFGCKLVWIREACIVLNPNDPLLAPHMQPIFVQVYRNLHQKLLNSSGAGLMAFV